MAAVTLVPADLDPFAEISYDKATVMIDDAMALAVRVAPCITTAEFEHEAAARAILRGAILRWHEAGSGAYQSKQVGPFGEQYDTRQARRSMFWPSEIEQLQELCRTDADVSGAFSLDQVPATAGATFADRPDLWFQWIFPVPDDAP